MTWCDEALAGVAEPSSREGYERALQIVRNLSIDDLRQAWRVVNLTRYSERTNGTRLFASYFDGLGQNEPERACDFILGSIRYESDDEQVAMIGQGKLLGQLLLNHRVLAQSRLASAAERSDRLRWLLGSAYWLIKSGLDPESSAVLAPFADRDAWEAWRERTCATGDIASLSLNELASRWIEANARSPIERERDDLHSTLFDLCFDLARDDRSRGLELTLAILARTDDKPLLGLLAAGLLEDLVCSETEAILAAIEAEAARDPKFRNLLAGVWITRVSPTTAARIERARAGAMPF